MIERIKNDELSVLCGFSKLKKFNLINEFISEFTKKSEVIYIDYEFNRNEIETFINKNEKLNIICKKINSDKEMYEDIITDSEYIILNYPKQLNHNNDVFNNLQTHAKKYKKKIIMFSLLPI